tara:strand:- start:1399 stop:1896 length:498 start_codon:yes stop_codon:yes gene_type:complete
MKVTIIPADKFISVGGTAYLGISTDWSYVPSGVHAVQWDGSSGEVEYNDGSPNVGITSLGVYEAAVTHHETERLRLAAIEAAEQAQLANKDWDNEFRRQRRFLLEDCDWTQANDSPLSTSKKTEWATYRQVLRDLPSNKDEATRKAMAQAKATNTSHSGWPTPPS